MRTNADLQKMKTEELVSILESKTGVKLPKKIALKRKYVIDLFKNKLHGIEFIRDDESIKNKTIIHNLRKPKPVTKKDCPNCKVKESLVSQPFPKGSEFEGAFWCDKCGYYQLKGDNK